MHAPSTAESAAKFITVLIQLVHHRGTAPINLNINVNAPCRVHIRLICHSYNV